MKNYFTGHYYTAEALKSAYRELSLDHHPDRATVVMQAINAEYEALRQQLETKGVAGWSLPELTIKDQTLREPARSDRQNIPLRSEDHAANVAHIEWQREQKQRDAEARQEQYRVDEMNRIWNSHVMPL